MTHVQIRPNVKLAKLFYKYMEEPKEKEQIEKKTPTEQEEEYESYPPYNFSWFIENKVAAMGWPQTVANLNYLSDVGVNHLITLSPEKIPPILDCEKKLKWSEIRVKEFGAPTLKQILKFIEICERAEIRGEVVGVHCRHGRGRTGTMLACYLVYFKGMAPERAVLTVRVQRPGSCETYEQEKIVCHYHDCVRGTITKPDYRMVEDKQYFDASMKYVYDDSSQDGDTDDESQTEAVQQKITKLQLQKKKSKVVGVHCRHGRGRTGTMLACYLVYFKGMAPERAVLTVRVQRPGSCETYEQEKIVCHYHDCVRGTITKPDYRMVEDKQYFDASMKYVYDDSSQDGDTDDESQTEAVQQKITKLQLQKKKSKAMIINHKIYF